MREATEAVHNPTSDREPIGTGSPTQFCNSKEDTEGKQTKRMFWVVPNFSAVSADTQLSPLLAKEKFRLAMQDTVDYSSFAWAGILSLQSWATNSNPKLGHGIAGYGRYYWRTFADGLSGTQVFRFDTFGDEAFWGDTLKLHQAIEGAKLAGVGPGVSPATALAVGLKVDIDALPSNLVQQIEKGRVNLNDPAVTLALLKLNAVIGITGRITTLINGQENKKELLVKYMIRLAPVPRAANFSPITFCLSI
jgi:hypothetical protein